MADAGGGGPKAAPTRDVPERSGAGAGRRVLEGVGRRAAVAVDDRRETVRALAAHAPDDRGAVHVHVRVAAHAGGREDALVVDRDTVGERTDVGTRQVTA